MVVPPVAMSVAAEMDELVDELVVVAVDAAVVVAVDAVVDADVAVAWQLPKPQAVAVTQARLLPTPWQWPTP